MDCDFVRIPPFSSINSVNNKFHYGCTLSGQQKKLFCFALIPRLHADLIYRGCWCRLVKKVESCENCCIHFPTKRAPRDAHPRAERSSDIRWQNLRLQKRFVPYQFLNCMILYSLFCWCFVCLKDWINSK